MIDNRNTLYGASFDDVLLSPMHSYLEKRKDAHLDTWALSHPIISAPMSSVTESKMALAMQNTGGLGIIHRFMEDEERFKHFLEATEEDPFVGIAVGLKDDFEYLKRFFDYDCRVFCLDVAHAHHFNVAGFAYNMANLFSGANIIVGNVATAGGARYLVDHGATAIKVGIGPGAACRTREVTGFGVPQLQAIHEVAWELRDDDVAVIADGGIKNSGDIVKAIGAGADAVMLGSLLAGADEAPFPGEYFGMASHRVNGHKAPEGVTGHIEKRGPVADIIEELVWGIKSGISYSGYKSLEEFKGNGEFIRCGPGVARESAVRV